MIQFITCLGCIRITPNLRKFPFKKLSEAMMILAPKFYTYSLAHISILFHITTVQLYGKNGSKLYSF